MDTYISPATAEKLTREIPKGERHQAKVEIAMDLLGNGMPDAAVVVALREKFPNASEKEIEGVVSWARQQHPTPSGTNGHVRFHTSNTFTRPVEQAKPRSPVEQCEWWTHGGKMTPEDLVALSPIEIPTNRSEYLKLALASLYPESVFLNVVCKFTLDEKKCRPSGGGKTLTCGGWIKYLEQNGVPSSQAGAWFRINPCGEHGTGKDEAVMDEDITKFMFCLIESDVLPLGIQLELYRRWRLPIAAILMSGGKSAHAWVRVSAEDGDQYKEIINRLLASIKPFGIDQGNKNPSRLSRLPGAMRVLGAAENGEQRLLWLNPNVAPLTLDALAKFEETLTFPYILDKPLLPLAQAAVDRYQAMVENRGKLGVPTGIYDFDKLSGGLKKGQTLVVSGETGSCKSTLALHMVKSALEYGVGVLLFSLEMDQEEIFDLLVSDWTNVDRNHFNNGEFTEHDLVRMTDRMADIKNLPLFIEDSSLTSADQIKTRVMQLKADNRIGLVVVDYIQFVNPGYTKESREQQVAGISHTLRTVARESQLPMVVLSQLNDDGKLRESRVISHNANTVLNVKVDGDMVIVEVTKGRGVPLGQYKMQFERKYARLISEGTISESDVPRSSNTWWKNLRGRKQ